MFNIEHDRERDMIVIRASGKLTPQDCAHAIPELYHSPERFRGLLPGMIRLEDVQWRENGALWRELKFDLGHRDGFGGIDVIDEMQPEAWGTPLSARFEKAEMRFFRGGRETEGRDWPTGAESETGGAG